MTNNKFAFRCCGLVLCAELAIAVRVRRQGSRSAARKAEKSRVNSTSEVNLYAALMEDFEGQDLNPGDAAIAQAHAHLVAPELHMLDEHARRSPCLAAGGPAGSTTYPCVNGWRSHGQCIGPYDEFTYSEQTLSGCVTVNASYSWCSTNRGQYRTRGWQRCLPCHEDPDGSSGGMEAAWTAVAKPLRCVDVAMTVGDSSGNRLYTFENGARNLNEQFPAASGSKWPAAVAILTTVRDGLMTLDTPARTILNDFWTQNPADPKYGVTLRHLMQFTSGFKVAVKVLSMSHDLFRQRCLNYEYGRGSLGDNFWGCIRHLYDSSPYEGTPGAAWQYNSIHLQLAFAMAVRVTGQSPTEFLRARVYHNMHGEHVMRNTYFVGGDNPAVALGIQTTGNDYDAFLRNYMSYKYLPEALCNEMERENLAANAIPKMRPGISFGDAFGMALFMYPSLYADCFGLGGTMVVCMNRAVGLYYLIVPPLRDYLKKGRLPIRMAGGAEKITFYSARFWIEHQLYNTYEVVTGRALGNRNDGLWPDVAEA